MIPPDVIEDILRRVSIVELISQHITLKKAGHNYKGLCPFHNDRNNPSLSVSDQKGLYHCFSCGAGGNALTFLKEYSKLDFVDSIKELGKLAGIDVEFYLQNQPDLLPLRNKLKTMHQIAQEFYVEQLFTINNPQTELAVRTIKKRKLDKKTIELFGLGFGGIAWDGLFKKLQSAGFKIDEIVLSGLCGKSENNKFYDRFRNRITFPIFDSEGIIVAFGGRIIDDSSNAKYINSPETPLFKKGSLLYGWNLAKETSLELGNVILVEGYMDVIRMFQAGFSTAVAPLGTGLTEDRISFLKHKVDTIILCFDGDSAGQKSTYRSAGIAAKLGVPTKVAVLPENEDPDTFLLYQGPNAMAKILDTSIEAEIFILDSAKSKLPDSNKFLQDVFEYAIHLEGDSNSPSLHIKTEQFLKKVSEILLVSYGSIELEFSRFKEQFLKFNNNNTWEDSYSKEESKPNKEFQEEFELLSILIMFPEFADHVASIVEPSDFYHEESQELFKKMLLHPEFTAQDWIISAGNTSLIAHTSKWLEAPDIRIIKNYAVSIRIKSLKKKRDLISKQLTNLDPIVSAQILEIQTEVIALKREFYHL